MNPDVNKRTLQVWMNYSIIWLVAALAPIYAKLGLSENIIEETLKAIVFVGATKETFALLHRKLTEKSKSQEVANAEASKHS